MKKIMNKIFGNVTEALQDAGDSLSLTEIIDHTLTFWVHENGELNFCRNAFRSVLNNYNYNFNGFLGNNEFEAMAHHVC